MLILLAWGIGIRGVLQKRCINSEELNNPLGSRNNENCSVTVEVRACAHQVGLVLVLRSSRSVARTPNEDETISHLTGFELSNCSYCH